MTKGFSDFSFALFVYFSDFAREQMFPNFGKTEPDLSDSRISGKFRAGIVRKFKTTITKPKLSHGFRSRMAIRNSKVIVFFKPAKFWVCITLLKVGALQMKKAKALKEQRSSSIKLCSLYLNLEKWQV